MGSAGRVHRILPTVPSCHDPGFSASETGKTGSNGKQRGEVSRQARQGRQDRKFWNFAGLATLARTHPRQRLENRRLHLREYYTNIEMDAGNQTKRDLRTPGEIAFDRCFFPFALFFLFPSFVDIQSLPLRWIGIFFMPLAIVLWGRALISLIKGWRDPAAKILRVVSLVLLLLWTPPFCLAIRGLLQIIPL
jgi:hypothetical protein